MVMTCGDTPILEGWDLRIHGLFLDLRIYRHPLDLRIYLCVMHLMLEIPHRRGTVESLFMGLWDPMKGTGISEPPWQID